MISWPVYPSMAVRAPLMESKAKACYLRPGMQTKTLAIVRPHAAGDHELAGRLSKGFRASSQAVTMYLSSEVCVLSDEVLSGTTLLVASPKRCIETSGDESVFLSKVACAQKRILASIGRVDSSGYLGRLQRGIHFDAVLDLGFASQEDRHAEISEVPYHFVFNGPTREEELLAKEPANPEERTIPWVLVGPKSESNRDLLGELFEQGVDPGLQEAESPRYSVARGSLRSSRRQGSICGAPTVKPRIMRVFALSNRCWQGRCRAR